MTLEKIDPLHTVICTDKLVKTVNFYEDYFGFYPIFENKEYVILEREGTKDHLAIIDVNHDSLPEGFKTVTTGLMINIYVDDLKEAYEHYYYEGLDIANDLDEGACGQKYFMLRDPNNNLITIVEKNHNIVTLADDDCPPVSANVTPPHKVSA